LGGVGDGRIIVGGNNMKVFLSWSGDLSKQVASLMNEWIGDVLQGTEGWFSPDDIDKGSIWFNDISKELSGTAIGILFCNKENLNAPWLMFEAGALSKGLSKSRVCPLLIDIKPSELYPPLSQFNATACNRDEMLKLIKTINDNNPNKLNDDRVNKSYDMWWPKFEKKYQEVVKSYKPIVVPDKKPTEDMVEEIVENTRAIRSELSQYYSLYKKEVLKERVRRIIQSGDINSAKALKEQMEILE
jgi:hypothetical protein